MLQDNMRSDKVFSTQDEVTGEVSQDLTQEISELEAEFRRGSPARLADFLLDDEVEVAEVIYELYDGTQLEEWFFDQKFGGIHEAAKLLVEARRQLEDAVSIDATSLILVPLELQQISVEWRVNYEAWHASCRVSFNGLFAHEDPDPVEAFRTVLGYFRDEIDLVDDVREILEMLDEGHHEDTNSARGS